MLGFHFDEREGGSWKGVGEDDGSRALLMFFAARRTLILLTCENKQHVQFLRNLEAAAAASPSEKQKHSVTYFRVY